MKWRDELTQRQEDEVGFAEVYAADFGHGTCGHNRLMLINKLAEMLDELSGNMPLPPSNRVVLEVPYHSQHEDDAQRYRRDCGPACVEMVGKFYYPGSKITTDQIMRYITQGSDRSTYISELQKASLDLFQVGLTRVNGAEWQSLVRWIKEGKPIIVLVHYGSFATRMDRGWTTGHYLVVVGHEEVEYQGETVERVILHDPDYYGGNLTQGAFIPVTKAHFEKMWEDCHLDSNPKRMALVPNG